MEQLVNTLISYGTTCALIAAFYKLFSESSKKDLGYLNEKIEAQNEKIDKLEVKIEKIFERSNK